MNTLTSLANVTPLNFAFVELKYALADQSRPKGALTSTTMKSWHFTANLTFQSVKCNLSNMAENYCIFLKHYISLSLLVSVPDQTQGKEFGLSIQCMSLYYCM